MKCRMILNNLNVFDLCKSLQFYEDAFDLRMVKKDAAEDYSYIIVYMADGNGDHLLKLTWFKGLTTPYNLGDNKSYLAIEVDDIIAARVRHRQMCCIFQETPGQNNYFVQDPDGHLIEVVQGNKNY